MTNGKRNGGNADVVAHPGHLLGSDHSRAGDHNQRVVLQTIRVHEPVIKPIIGEITGLTAPTISGIIGRLMDAGIVREAGLLQGPRGQPAMRYAINPDGAISLGLNVDRDHVTLVALDFNGAVRDRATVEVDFALPDFILSFLEEQIARLVEQKLIDRTRLIGIGVALPDDLGGLDLPHQPTSYEIWDDFDLASAMRSAYGLPVFIENDATAAALGELQFGHGLADRTFFYVFIGAFMGGGLVVDGQAVSGADGRSGEIGFLSVDPTGQHPQMLQDVVSVSGLLKRLETSGFPEIDVAALAHLKGRARTLCEEWCDEAADLLIPPLLMINAIINPRSIYLGGRLPSWLLDRLIAMLNERLWQRTPQPPRRALLQKAQHADDAGALGAAVLPFSELLLPTRSAILKG